MTEDNSITASPGMGEARVLRIIDILHDTTVDGPGFRTSIYCAGCRHECPGCHNPQSWPFDAGRDMTVEEVLGIILSDPFANVTFTGGDPFYQAEAFASLARKVKEESVKTIWAYTGFLFEQLQGTPLLPLIDVLVDGPFVMARRDKDLLFRGSANQRLIRVADSLKAGSIVLYSPEM